MDTGLLRLQGVAKFSKGHHLVGVLSAGWTTKSKCSVRVSNANAELKHGQGALHFPTLFGRSWRRVFLGYVR
jgi:hypothetical protein